ncbi:MAG: 16S rRNA (cytosine(1402)-N(4))-methyltransferase RsmH [Bacteroidia bacterium]|nr:16S rRNA (cytosine(1402)-N(4))-methyltransferase RsmH [Bacteroidia bacterium]
MTPTYHDPVLLDECINGLNIVEDGTYVDATYGGGGHSKKILEKLKGGKLVAFDQDEDAFAQKLDSDQLIFIQQNFSMMMNYLKFYKMLPVNGIIADLGISSHQIDTPERGFSIRYDGDLDMRMNRNQEVKAATIINTYREEELQNMFSKYGEVHNAKTLSATIINAREKLKINTVAEFIEAIKPCFQEKNRNKYLAKVFQALRIEVNDEINTLKKFLLQCQDSLASNGRLVIISYHSLEDRIVKRFLKTGNFEGEQKKDFYGNPIGQSFNLITKKAIIPTSTEIISNPRSRSAKLRIAEKR